MAKSEKNSAETKSKNAESEVKATKAEAKVQKAEKKSAAPKKDKKARAKKSANFANFETIKSPVITEKSTMAGEFGKYTFKVCVNSSKTQVRDAVEALFGVEVTKVNVINYDGKVKAFRQRMGQRNAYKKAIVTLREGQSIDLTSGLKG